MKKLLIGLLALGSFSAYATLNCQYRSDFKWSEAKTYNVDTVKDASDEKQYMILEASDLYSGSISTMSEVFAMTDENEVMISNAYYPKNGETYTTVSFFAGDNTFEYLFNKDGEIATYIVDGSCE